MTFDKLISVSGPLCPYVEKEANNAALLYPETQRVVLFPYPFIHSVTKYVI